MFSAKLKYRSCATTEVWLPAWYLTQIIHIPGSTTAIKLQLDKDNGWRQGRRVDGEGWEESEGRILVLWRHSQVRGCCGVVHKGRQLLQNQQEMYGLFSSMCSFLQLFMWIFKGRRLEKLLWRRQSATWNCNLSTRPLRVISMLPSATRRPTPPSQVCTPPNHIYILWSFSTLGEWGMERMVWFFRIVILTLNIILNIPNYYYCYYAFAL